MSSPDSIKKRRIATTGNSGGGGGNDNGIVDDGSTTMSKILAKMNDMQNEMNGMKDELDSCISSRDAMQKEMDGMQSRLSHMDELEKKCTHLDTRCESLQRSVEILSKESTWEYSAPPIPLSHWRGFDEGYIEEIQKLLSDIQRYTFELRRGKVLDDIHFGLDDVILPHDDMLLPHWEELANALQLYMGRYSLQIENMQLTSEVLDLLAPALKGKLLTGFVLDNNDFEEDIGTKFTTECIESNLRMKAFYLSNNQLGNMKNATTVLDAVINHHSIDKVQLENCLGGDINSYEVVRPVFASDKSWELLDLERNNIKTEGDSAIPDYIVSNPPLENLFLSSNKLNDEDAILIAHALKQNTNLQRLHLHRNDFTYMGKETLSKAVYDPTSLNTIYDCNHTCQLELDRIDNGLPLFCNNNGPSNPRSKRSMKIHYILSLRHREMSNVQHLNLMFEDEEEDSLKLAPKILETVHKSYQEKNSYSYSINPLSIMYEIVRGWKIPEYEKRS